MRMPTRCSIVLALAKVRMSVSSGPGLLDTRKLERTSMDQTCLRESVMSAYSSVHSCKVRFIDNKSVLRRSSASTRVMVVVLLPRQRSHVSSTRVDWSNKQIEQIPACRRITSLYSSGEGNCAHLSGSFRHSWVSDRLRTRACKVRDVVSSD